jgi:glycosyltransferase involved in cell wall biosynthesis
MFDVIIPTYNNLDELKECLNGFSKQTFRNFNVFVCIDGSTDGTIEFLKTASYNFELTYLTHPNNEHKGRNETRNLSLENINSEYLLLFDSDIIPEEELLQKHFDLLNQKDCVSIGEIIYNNTSDNVWALYLQSRGKGKYPDLAEIPGFYLNTQNVAFKSDYYIKLKGQDPELSKNYGGDDTVLGYKMEREFNVPFIFNKSALGYSSMNKNLSKALMQMQEFGAVNLKIIRRKYPELNQIFRFYIIESNSLRHKIIRLLAADFFAWVLLKLITVVPDALAKRIVHYLVFQSIYKGYKTGTY